MTNIDHIILKELKERKVNHVCLKTTSVERSTLLHSQTNGSLRGLSSGQTTGIRLCLPVEEKGQPTDIHRYHTDKSAPSK